jgi:hypothetical protein
MRENGDLEEAKHHFIHVVLTQATRSSPLQFEPLIPQINDPSYSSICFKPQSLNLKLIQRLGLIF